MSSAEIVLVLATLLCSLVAGFLFAFAVVVMPGIRRLPDREFVRAFQEIDGVIQRGQPLFGLVWIGSVVALVAGVALGFGEAGPAGRALLLIAGALYILGVQLPTATVNVPLNNELQSVRPDPADEAAWASARARFERRWNRWNAIRTGLAVVSVAALCTLLTL